MLGRVVVENGVKKIVPLTADCGSGNPVGTVIAVYSNKVPNGYLPCNGVAFDTAQFPVLYALLQDDHTPDLRECTLVGAGTSDRTMGAHDEYTVGEFKDDQIQNITGSQELRNLVLNGSTNAGLTTPTQAGSLKSSETTRTSYTLISTNATTGTPVTKLEFDASLSARAGTTTHGKQVGVNWCIKATSGINENQADNVLSALSPVNAVTSGDMHAVTSNAVNNILGGMNNNGALSIGLKGTVWLKIGEFPNQGTGFVLELNIANAYTTNGSSAKRLVIIQGTSSNSTPVFYIEEKTASTTTLLTTLRIGYNQNWNDGICIYLKYSANDTHANPFKITFKYVGNSEFTPAFTLSSQTPTERQHNVEYALHNSGLYINGTKIGG